MNTEREKRILAKMAELRACREEAEITREANRRLDAEKAAKEAGEKATHTLLSAADRGEFWALNCARIMGLREC